MSINNPIKQISLSKIIIISVLSITAFIILFLSFIFILFYIYKDDISKTLLSSVNNKISGEVSFSDLSFTPFRYFPDASLIVYDLSLKECKDSMLQLCESPIFNIKKTYISVNIVDLFSSKINASGIFFEDGRINIIVYPDSVTNIEKALKSITKKETTLNNEYTFEEKSDSGKRLEAEKASDLDLQIKKFELNQVELILQNQITKNKAQLKINELESSLSYSQNSIFSSINLDINIDSLILHDKQLLSNQQINLETNLDIETDSIYIKIADGNLSIDEASLLFNGIFDSKKQGYLDLTFSLLSKDFSLLSFFISEESRRNLKSGEAFLNGTVKGKTYSEFPLTEISFGFKDVDLINPITNREIKNLNLDGYFNSGSKSDWSDAKLKIEKMKADFHDGVFKMSASANNLVSPNVEADIILSADVTGFDKIFKLGPITDLKGKIQFEDRFKGKFNNEEKKFTGKFINAKISFTDFGLKVPGTILFDKVNGVITGKNDDVQFESLRVISENTDFLINGEVKNAMALLFNREEEITGNLQIKSPIFDLPNFLAFDPSIKRDFNYRILDVDIDFLAATTTSKALKFKYFPEIDFDIKKLYATIENFIPRLQINSGNFKISESLLGFNMKFDKLKTDFLNGKFNFTAEYNSSKYEPFYIKAKTDFKDIYLSKLFYDEKDTIPASMKGKLSGSFLTDFQFPLDSTLLKFIRIKKADLVYKYSKDTIITKNLNVDLNKNYFNQKINSNPFATLFSNGTIKADSIKSNSFNFNDLDFNVVVINGKYEIKSDVVRLFGENAKGNAIITATPFTKIPSFRIIYNEVSFRAEKMLSAFKEDEVVNGPLKLSFNISSMGSEWETIVKNMNGTIKLSGEGLVLQGFDADEIIENFKRSQNFNLVDLGAVLLAGPVGIVVTKGSDFARILVFNSGKFTNINKLVSNWTVNNGIFQIQDAAFRTNINRIALTGLIGFANQNIDLTIALLNKYGCSIFSQQVYGNLDAPTLGKVKVVGTLLAPVTNLVDDVTGRDCDVFYSGSVEHPINKQ